MSTSSVWSAMELEDFRRQCNSRPWKNLKGALSRCWHSLSTGAVFLYSGSAFGPSSCSWCQGLVRASRKARLEPLSTKWGFPGQGYQIAPWKFQPKVKWNITIPRLLHGLLMARNLPSFLSLSLLNSLQIYLSITLMTITNLLNSD